MTVNNCFRVILAHLLTLSALQNSMAVPATPDGRAGCQVSAAQPLPVPKLPAKNEYAVVRCHSGAYITFQPTNNDSPIFNIIRTYNSSGEQILFNASEEPPPPVALNGMCWYASQIETDTAYPTYRIFNCKNS